MRKTIVFGAGISGIGAMQLLEKYNIEYILVDDKTGIKATEVLPLIEEGKINRIIKSPGISWNTPLLLLAKEKGIEIISEIDLAYEYMDKDIKIIGITGTNGKTTTATKVNELLNYAGKKSYLAGNAGYSLAGLIAKDTHMEYVVIELSSYQLENNPRMIMDIATIINLTPDHLSRYIDVYDYYNTKLNIFKNQNKDDIAIINLDDIEIINLIKNIDILSNKVYISRKKKADIYVSDNMVMINDRKLMNIEDLSLKGEHNLENVLNIVAIASLCNIDDNKIVEFLSTTKSLEHRMEEYYKYNMLTFINDSKGTNVDSTLYAIDAFKEDIILVVGGQDKKIDNTRLIDKIKEKVEKTYVIGENANILISLMDKIGYKDYLYVENINNALLEIKKEYVNKKKIILFSPATASFDQFKNFEDRGNKFKELTINIFKK